jgi:uncharacterized membrane protein YeaQ/YmgE (transglycosylase-associated protein family)
LLGLFGLGASAVPQHRKGNTDAHSVVVIVGLVAGWATGKIMKGAGYGAFMDVVIGIAGALLGGFVMRSLGFAGEGGLIYTIVVAIGGAVVLTAIARLVMKKN